MSLSELVSKLELYSQSDSHRQVYETGRKVLSQDPANEKALKQCLVALINLDRYETALKLIDEFKPKGLVLEQAYVFYKTNSGDKLEALTDAGKDLRGFQHILAQHYYKTGKNEAAMKVYQQLLAAPGAEAADLSVNERAVLSQMKDADETVSMELTSKDAKRSYDLMSNDALIRLSENRFPEALALLEDALSLAQEGLQGYDEASRVAELTPIRVQIAYVKQLLGQNEESRDILASLNVDSIDDPVLRLLITNNLMSLSSGHSDNPALAYRELGFPNSLHTILDRLTLPQTKTLQRNELVLAQRAGKAVARVAARHAVQFAGSCMGRALGTMQAKVGVEAADLAAKSSHRRLYRWSIKHPDDLPFALLACQASIAAGSMQNAALILDNVVSHDAEVLISQPSVAPLLYYVYERLDQKKSIVRLLSALYDGLIMREVASYQEYKLLEFAAFQLLSVDGAKSRQLFLKIEAMGNPTALVSAVLGDSAAALPSVSALTEDVDADALVEKGLEPLLASGGVKSILGGKIAGTKGKVVKPKAKRSRVKPKRLPKVLARQIDEERWLPLKDRSYYHSRKSKHKTTQGGVVDESLNMNDKEEEKEKEKVPASSGKAKKKKSKKKKGKK